MRMNEKTAKWWWIDVGGGGVALSKYSLKPGGNVGGKARGRGNKWTEEYERGSGSTELV